MPGFGRLQPFSTLRIIVILLLFMLVLVLWRFGLLRYTELTVEISPLHQPPRLVVKLALHINNHFLDCRRIRRDLVSGYGYVLGVNSPCPFGYEVKAGCRHYSRYPSCQGIRKHRCRAQENVVEQTARTRQIEVQIQMEKRRKYTKR